MLGISFLNEMHKSVLVSLNQNDVDAEVQDGMEMALCCIDIKNKILEFSGAMSSLYYIQNNQLKEIAGDYYSIGGKSLFGSNNNPNFTNKTLALENDTLLYLFTDGYNGSIWRREKSKI